jgi:ferric-dicitrate binding protein FerR (iron transport regulator)
VIKKARPLSGCASLLCRPWSWKRGDLRGKIMRDRRAMHWLRKLRGPPKLESRPWRFKEWRSECRTSTQNWASQNTITMHVGSSAQASSSQYVTQVYVFFIYVKAINWRTRPAQRVHVCAQVLKRAAWSHLWGTVASLRGCRLEQIQCAHSLLCHACTWLSP